MLFKSPVYTSVSGSIGGITYSHNKSGMYTRGRAIPTNPNTGKQTVVRAVMTDLVTAWTSSLTAGQRAGWNLYASNVPVINKLGDAVYRSGQQWFIGANTARMQLGAIPGFGYTVARVDTAPSTFDRGDFTTPTASWSATTGLSATFDNTDEWAQEDGSFMIFYQGRPQNSSINYFKGPWRIIGATEGDSMTPPASPEIITTGIMNAVGFPITSGQRIWLKVNVTRIDGRYSTPRIIGPEAITS